MLTNLNASEKARNEVVLKFNFCPKCGDELIEKNIGDEGLIPYCKTCEIPFFDWIPTCTISLVTDEMGRILLAKQGNVNSLVRWGLIAGYLKKGESAEASAQREILEEAGQMVDDLKFVKSYYYEDRALLMLGFHAKVAAITLIKSIEIDELGWFSFEEAYDQLREGSIAQQLLVDTLGEIYGQGKIKL